MSSNTIHKAFYHYHQKKLIQIDFIHEKTLLKNVYIIPIL